MANRDGFDAFYAATYGRVVGQLFAALGDLQEAEDAAQEAFARASQRWSQVRGYDRPEAWILRVAFNQARNRLRRSRTWLRLRPRLVPAPEMPELSADAVDLMAALRRLSLQHRQVLVLHYVEDLEVAQIAAQLRIPVGTVKSRLSRGRAVLMRLLDDRQEVPRA
jgi:RNA polymerase sigma-70 factor (ECF subfamily)